MLTIVEIVIASYCVYFVSYSAIFILASFFYQKKQLTDEVTDHHHIAVLVPAYKCDQVILNSAKRNLEVNYPLSHWRLFVIADGLQSDTNQKLDSLPLELVKVNLEESTKVRSLKLCMEHQGMVNFDSVVILDADNIMDHQFLKHVNQQLFKEKSIQGCRMAANQNNELAILDGISESLNIKTFRQGPEKLKLSVSLCGSGMAFEKESFAEVLQKMDSIGGFDRELEFELLSNGIRSSYLNEAVVFDEKTDDMSNLKKQRTRWLSSHFVYLKRYFTEGLRNLMQGNFVYFHSTILRNLQLPRAINIGLITVLTILAIGLSLFNLWHWKFWLLLWIINTGVTFLGIPKTFYNRKLFQAILKLPIVIGSLFLLLFKLRGANKKFIHTIHKPRK